MRMQQAVFSGPGKLAVEEVGLPHATGRDVLVRVEACGVCGSDRAIFRGEHPVSLPVVLGHEYAGVVVECGSDVAGLRQGDRVVVDPNVVCGRCSFCRRGAVNLCSNISPLGIDRPGGFAEFSVVPEVNAYRIPDAVSFEEAALVEPLACCIRGIQQAEIQLGDVVVVFGAGPIGLLLAQLAGQRGAAVVVCVETDSERRAMASAVGVDVVVDGSDPGSAREAVMQVSEGNGADVAIEATGQTAVAAAALDFVRPGGTVVWFGACPQDDRVEVRPFWVNDREISIRGSNVNPFTHQAALSLIAHGRIRPAQLVSDRIGLDELSARLAPGASLGKGKVLVLPGKAL